MQPRTGFSLNTAESHSEILLVPPAFPEARFVPLGEFNRSPVIRIGRALSLVGSGLEAQIKLRSRSVSKRHALLLNADGRIIVRDLGSRSGVLVNDRMVRQAIVTDGDRIQFGSIPLRIDRGRASGGRRPVPAVAAGVRDGSGALRSINSPLYLIGRQDSCDLVLSDEEVARVHAAIYQADGQHILRHLPARSSTLVNGQQWWEVVLQHGDRIEIAGSRLRFEISGQSLDHVHEAVRSGNRESESRGSSIDDMVDAEMGSGMEHSATETEEPVDAPPSPRFVPVQPPQPAAIPVSPVTVPTTKSPTAESKASASKPNFDSDPPAVAMAGPQKIDPVARRAATTSPVSISETSVTEPPIHPSASNVPSSQSEPPPQWVFDCGPIVISLAQTVRNAQPLDMNLPAAAQKRGRRIGFGLLVALALVVIGCGAAAVAWWRLGGV